MPYCFDVVGISRRKDGRAALIKTSKISQKRQWATNPLLNAAMQEKVNALYEDHYSRGILKTRRPLPYQVHNGDEIGFDPNGNTKRVISLGV
jgi:hypothetical protein